MNGEDLWATTQVNTIMSFWNANDKYSFREYERNRITEEWDGMRWYEINEENET